MQPSARVSLPGPARAIIDDVDVSGHLHGSLIGKP
jgi:hypothetical protein